MKNISILVAALAVLVVIGAATLYISTHTTGIPPAVIGTDAGTNTNSGPNTGTNPDTNNPTSVPTRPDQTPTPTTPTPPGGTWVCTMDAKICPDGSAVGRTGPKCEFAPCPPSTATYAVITTYLGGSPTVLNLTINPREVVSDNRCPQNVQCITAGTVRVRTAFSTPVAHGEQIVELNKAVTFGEYTITLSEVTPTPHAGTQTPAGSYRFTFQVQKS